MFPKYQQYKIRDCYSWYFVSFADSVSGNVRFEVVMIVNSFFLIPLYLQAVQIHLANGVKLLEAWRGVLSSTPPYK
jgi:riboflavin transporter FmnP